LATQYSCARPGSVPFSAERIFDGTRYGQYLERQPKQYERLQAKVLEAKKQQQERAERRFDREMNYQALTSPHFVATAHTHPDR